MAKDYELATGLDQKSQAICVATFCLLMGKDCLQIFLNLNFGTEEIMITSSLSALEDYFLPKRNLVYERFNSCIQTPEETVDGYINRLRKLASWIVSLENSPKRWFMIGLLLAYKILAQKLDCSRRKIYLWIRPLTCPNQVRLQTSRSSRFSMRATSRMKSFI